MGRCDSTRVGEGRKGRIILVIRSQSTDGTGEGGKEAALSLRISVTTKRERRASFQMGLNK